MIFLYLTNNAGHRKSGQIVAPVQTFGSSRRFHLLFAREKADKLIRSRLFRIHWSPTPKARQLHILYMIARPRLESFKVRCPLLSRPKDENREALLTPTTVLFDADVSRDRP